MWPDALPINDAQRRSAQRKRGKWTEEQESPEMRTMLEFHGRCDEKGIEGDRKADGIENEGAKE